jgi:hypothetical protein
MMTSVLATEMEGSSVQSYMQITTVYGFEMTNEVDKKQGLQNLSDKHHERASPPPWGAFGGCVF